MPQNICLIFIYTFPTDSDLFLRKAVDVIKVNYQRNLIG